ncbi:MAG: carboxylate-amine ligase [Thermoflexales bacterium]
MLKRPSFNIGIEEEYQIIDPKTRELRSYITQLLEDAAHLKLIELELKPELHQSIVEVGTRVCNTPSEAREELIRLRRNVIMLAERNGLKIAAAGTHPFSHWRSQAITPLERYTTVRSDMAQLAQQLLIFGTHVHIGIEDAEFMIDCMKVVRYFVPHVLCLSTSSPFWLGEDTGLKSYRSVIFSNFPRTGIPPIFNSYHDFNQFVNTLVRTHCIPDGTKIWWDVRPNAKYPTLEFRACDVCTRIEEAVCVAAIFQALCYKLWKMRRDNITFRVYPTELINENKWRAMRYGLDGQLIDLGKQEEKPARELIRELVGWFLDDVLDELGSRKEVEYAYRILEEGSSADRQLATYQTIGDLRAVVDQVISETEEGTR